MSRPLWMQNWTWSRPNNVGLFLLGLWMLVTGVMQLFDLRIPHSDVALALLAITAGLVILLDVRTGTLIVVVILLIALAAVLFMLR